jgi:hypothetical protein
MDPYLEAPDIWPDFHNALAGEIRGQLNATLPQPYYARLEMRPEVGVVEEGGYTRRVVPDVAVVRHQGNLPVGSVALLDAPRSQVSAFYEFAPLDEPIAHHFVEVRDASRGHKLVTLIEIVSPSNKRRGPDRQSYLQKQQEVLASDASLVEIDLLRTGERLFADPRLAEFVASIVPRPDYLVLVNRAWQRDKLSRGFRVFPATVRDLLPCIDIPLREGEEVLLDLQVAFNRAYDSGPYRRGAVDYSSPPQPLLGDEDAAWAEALLRS